MRSAIGLWLVTTFVLAASLGRAQEIETVADVVGVAKCADCKENNFDTKKAFEGLSVRVHCKAANGVLKARGSAALDDYGRFKLSLPKAAATSEQCYVQLRSASSSPCPTQGSLEATKLVQSRYTKGALGPVSGTLHFSPATCASKYFWHFFQNQPDPSMNGPLGPLPIPPRDEPLGPLPVPPMDGPMGPLPLPPMDWPTGSHPCPPKDGPPRDGPLGSLPCPRMDWPNDAFPCPPKDRPVEHDTRAP